MSRIRAGALASVLAASCAAGGGHVRVPVAVVATGAEKLPASAPVWIVGIAENAKMGAVVRAGDLVVRCADRTGWPDDVHRRPVVAAGVVTARTLPPLPVGPGGERYAGAEGTELVLTPCETPPRTDEGLDALIDAEKALFAGLAQRDADGLARIVAPELVMRAPGQPDVDRAAFLRAVTAVPGEILAVEGEAMEAHRAGDTGIVRGVQVARVRTGGKVVEQRQTFVDVFVRRGGAWLLTFALIGPA
jgi:hypothetical protein